MNSFYLHNILSHNQICPQSVRHFISIEQHSLQNVDGDSQFMTVMDAYD